MAKVTMIPPADYKEKAQLRCAAYCRVSTDSEDQKNSYDAQMRYFAELFEDSPTEMLIGIYADEGISGTGMGKRTQFNRLMEDCRKGKIDRIYAKSISRFARNTKDCLKCIRELKGLGISIYFEKENIDTLRVTDEIMITIMGGLAQEEAQSISGNVRWGFQKRMKAGTLRHSAVPYGYDKDEESGGLKINEEQAVVVRRIFDMYVNGSGRSVIAITLNNEGVRSPSGKPWKGLTVARILENEKYIGDTLWQKTYTEFMGKKSQKNTGQLPQYYIKDSHPAIIARATFELAQKLREDAQRGEFTHIDSPFEKKVKCGCCGWSYSLGKHHYKISWVCGKKYDIISPCKNVQVSQAAMESAFRAMCDKLRINGIEILAAYKRQLQELNSLKAHNSVDTGQIYKEMAAHREQLHVLSKLRTKRFISENKYMEQAAAVDGKLAKLQNKLDRITDTTADSYDDIDMLIDIFSEDEPMSQKELADAILEKIIIADGKIEFHLAGDLRFKERINDHET